MRVESLTQVMVTLMFTSDALCRTDAAHRWYGHLQDFAKCHVIGLVPASSPFRRPLRVSSSSDVVILRAMAALTTSTFICKDGSPQDIHFAETG